MPDSPQHSPNASFDFWVTRPQGSLFSANEPIPLQCPLSRGLKGKGWQVHTEALLALTPLPFDRETALQELRQSDWLFFTSQRAIEGFLAPFIQADQTLAPQLLEALPAIGVVGKETGEFLKQWGIQPQYCPPKSRGGRYAAQGFLNTITPPAQTSILWPGPQDPQPEFESHLVAHQLQVHRLPVYTSSAVSSLSPSLLKALEQPHPPWIVLTSPNGVQALADVLEQSQITLPLQLPLGSMGKSTRQAIETLYPSHPIIEPRESSFHSLIEELHLARARHFSHSPGTT